MGAKKKRKPANKNGGGKSTTQITARSGKKSGALLP